MQKRISPILFPVIGLSAALSAATPPEGVATLYGDWSSAKQLYRTTKVWSSAMEGEKVAWTQGAYGIVTAVCSLQDSFSFKEAFEFWGLRFEHASDYNSRWDSGTVTLDVGAGGVEFTKSGALTFGGATGAMRLRLTASQTWKGPDDAGTPAYLSIGHDHYLEYFKAGVTAAVDCAALTVSGNLAAWFTWTNHFGATEIRVEKPARVWLEKSWNNGADRIGTPQLNARKLVLSGDGVMWNAGGQSTIYNSRGRKPQLEPEMNSVTVAGALALENGADLAGDGAGWDIPSVEVYGSGVSEFTGDWTFRRARTAVSVADGATFALSGTCFEEEGLSAGFDVTGSGKIKIVKSAYLLTGPISLSGSTLEVEGTGLPGVPVTGTGCIIISGTDEGAAPVCGKSLAGFTGTLRIRSGNVHLDSMPVGVTVETTGTGSVLTDESLPEFSADWSGNLPVWQNSAGETATPVSMSDITVAKVGGLTCNITGTYVFHGMTMSATRTAGFWLPGADFSVGSGGITFTTACDLPFGNIQNNMQLKLIADQEWKGPSSGAEYATLQIGFPGYSQHGYHRARLGAGDDAQKLKISGMLMAYLTATNELHALDVEIAAPAKLVLCNTWYAGGGLITGDAHLGAKSLTLSGDGSDHLPLGATGVFYPYISASGVSTITALDSAHVADALILKDGADLNAVSPVSFGLPGFSASGSGTSVLSGTFSVLSSAFDVVLADGATVDLAGTISETRSGTTFSATGSGTVIVRAGYGLSGGISLGADVALKVMDRDVFLQPVIGGKSIGFAAPEGGALFVPGSVIAGFTGDRIEVTSGTVVFETVPQGVCLVEAGGKARLAAETADDPWLVTDAVRTESRIVVEAGRTLKVCGDGLTGNTVLELAGGRVEFLRSAAIASPVECTASSSIGALADVTGTVAGYVTASNDSESVECRLSLAGKGTVDLSGGGAFDRVILYVSEGSANLTGGRTVVNRANIGVSGKGEYFGIRDSAVLECLRPASGSYHLVCKPDAGTEGVIDIATGGVVRLNHNVGIYIGRKDDTVGMPGTLRISGGSLSVSRGYSFVIGDTVGGRGRLEFLDGEIVTDQGIRCYEGASADIAWYGGTVKLGDEFRTWVGNSDKTVLTSVQSNITFRILGSGCRLDLNGAAAFTNVLAGADNSGSWTATEGACLTVANGGECVLNRFAQGGWIGVDGCSVLLNDPDEPELGGVVFRGKEKDTVEVSPASSRTVDTVVAAGAMWGLGQLDGLGAGNILFEDGAALRLAVSADGMIGPVEVVGSVTCEGVLGIDFESSGSRPAVGAHAVLSASGGLNAPTSFVGLSKATRDAVFSAVGNIIFADVVQRPFTVVIR